MTTVLGFYGTNMDAGGKRRWDRWRPTLSLFQHPDRVVDRLELLVGPSWRRKAQSLIHDIERISPETEICVVDFPLDDPWDFQEVFGALLDHAEGREPSEDEDLLVHITTGTHVAQICLFLLVEAGFLRGRLLQTGPIPRGKDVPGWDAIDLDLARYERINQRFEARQAQDADFLKRGIQTRNAAFNDMIRELELIASASRAPILLSGPTGAGKSHLAERIGALKRRKGQIRGPMVSVNCATLRGDKAMAALFGHSRGAFTGAQSREGLLRRADGGLLFLDEIGELGLDEQAVLLRAIESGRFLPLGSDVEVESDFQLIAGTNRDLRQAVSAGRFREDLLARIDLWHFELPGLAQRPEDIAPNLDYELLRHAQERGRKVAFNTEARRAFLRFAHSPEAAWRGNFRDLNGAVTRMATLSTGGRIRMEQVEAELVRLRRRWQRSAPPDLVAQLLGPDVPLDRFERVQLNEVIRVCREQPSAAAAGRVLFAESRKARKTHNDGDRLRKYLAKFELDFEGVRGG